MIRVERHTGELEILADTPPRPLAPRTRERVDALWTQARAEGRAELYDGRLFNVVTRKGARFHGGFADYRCWIAQRRDPSLFGELRVEPLAVLGLVRVGDALLLARRSEQTVQDPGCWELAPSGGIGADACGGDGRVDAGVQLLAELHEELNVSGDGVAVVTPAFRVYDPDTRVHELAFDVQLTLSVAALHERFEARGAAGQRPEYSALALVPTREVPAFVRDTAGTFAEVSRAVLRCAGLL